jgi:hypothetical protein
MINRNRNNRMSIHLDGELYYCYPPFRVFRKGDVPKSYRRIRTVYHDWGNDYNKSIATLYRTAAKGLVLEMYRDGSIYPYRIPVNPSYIGEEE